MWFWNLSIVKYLREVLEKIKMNWGLIKDYAIFQLWFQLKVKGRKQDENSIGSRTIYIDNK